jgi:fibronectin type 3 domain-containing protein
MGKTAALDSRMSAELSVTSGIAKPVLKTSIDASGKPELRWQTVEGAVKYEIYRSTKSTKSYSLLTTVEATGYTDESVAPGKTYYYKVIAIGAVSKSAESSYAKLSGKCATPQISVTINEDSGKPQLTWEKVNGAKQYTVYRSTDKFSGFKKLGTTKTLSYIDTKATVGVTYFYTVVANHKTSKYSSSQSYPMGAVTVCGTPSVTLKNDAASGKPVLSWSKITGAVSYEVCLLGGEDYVVLGEVTGTSFKDESCAVGEGRYYGVRAIAADEANNSQVSEPVFGRGVCAQPKLTGLLSADGKPSFYWDSVEGAVKYVIYRSTSATKGYQKIDELPQDIGPFYIDDTAKKGKTYYYKVVAVDEMGESEMSAYVKLKSK